MKIAILGVSIAATAFAAPALADYYTVRQPSVSYTVWEEPSRPVTVVQARRWCAFDGMAFSDGATNPLGQVCDRGSWRRSKANSHGGLCPATKRPCEISRRDVESCGLMQSQSVICPRPAKGAEDIKACAMWMAGPGAAGSRSHRKGNAIAGARDRRETALAQHVIDMRQHFAEGEAHLVRVVDDAVEHHRHQLGSSLRGASACVLDGAAACIVGVRAAERCVGVGRRTADCGRAAPARPRAGAPSSARASADRRRADRRPAPSPRR